MSHLKQLLLITVLAFVGVAKAEDAPAAKPLTIVTQSADGRSLLADSVGKTLYVFDIDQNKPAPACKGDCAEIWPPYLLTAAEVEALQAPFGVIQRTSEQPQLTYNGRPVYTYIFDRQAGDILGDGLGKVWHLITP